MKLTGSSFGKDTVDGGFLISKKSESDKVIALAGNPNVGKSTVFNALTGLCRHTGNWPGKTATKAQGFCRRGNRLYVLVDIPGTYSLMTHSVKEEAARNFICFGEPDAVVVVCDAACLERNLNLVLQTVEICPHVVVCVNLMDEAEKKKIRINLPLLSYRLGLPVVGTNAHNKKSLNELLSTLDRVTEQKEEKRCYTVRYPAAVEKAVALLLPVVEKKCAGRLNSRWLSLRLLDCDLSLIKEIEHFISDSIFSDDELISAVMRAKKLLFKEGIESTDRLKDLTVTSLVQSAEALCRGVVYYGDRRYTGFDRWLDNILTGRLTGYPVMLAFLALIFWLTISGANVPSQALAQGLFWVQDRLTGLFLYLGAPEWLHRALVFGVYRGPAWMASVMFPPMIIFFSLFTLLENTGYLSRVAYNLDKPFRRCSACGKQALCMSMSFDCNAASVIGCRIIDSPRERLLAILTASFMPCNGQFSTMIVILTVFFAGASVSAFASFLSALLLTVLIVLGILLTLTTTKALSKTFLRGMPSSFVMELPPYRTPQIGFVFVRSILVRTLFLLGRTVAVIAPVGLIIWIAANISVGGMSLLSHIAGFLDPFASLMGLDGVILLAFILSFPANEIVFPIIIMAYTAQGNLTNVENLSQMKALFIENGWTWATAVSTLLFSLCHFPCFTTLLTVRKETGSLKWTVFAAALPTAFGVILCILFTIVARRFVS